MKVQPVPYDPGEGVVPLVAELIACDECGIVAIDTPVFGWKRWTDETGVLRHHCPQSVQYNELVRNLLVHNVAPETAVDYEEWGEPDHDEDDYALTMQDVDQLMAERVELAGPVMVPSFVPDYTIDLGDDPDGDCDADPRDT